MKYLLVLIFGLCSFTAGAMLGLFPDGNKVQVLGEAAMTSIKGTVTNPILYNPEQYQDKMNVELITDEEKVTAVLNEYNSSHPNQNIEAYSIILGNTCLIYAYEPVYDGDKAMQILGHEITHCFRGWWDETVITKI